MQPVGWVERSDTHHSIKAELSLACGERVTWQKSFHSTASSGSLSLIGQRESHQRESTPGAAPRALRARGSLRFSALWGRSTVHPCTDRECGDPSPHPCGPCPQSLRCSARLRGTQDQEPDQKRDQDQKRSRHSTLVAFCFLLFASGFCGRECRPNGAPVGRRVGVGKPAGWRARCAPVRCVHKDVHSANPVARSRTRRAGCPKSAPPGWPSLWLLSLGHPRESDSLAAGE